VGGHEGDGGFGKPPSCTSAAALLVRKPCMLSPAEPTEVAYGCNPLHTN
jgi:hypothetical protein